MLNLSSPSVIFSQELRKHWFIQTYRYEFLKFVKHILLIILDKWMQSSFYELEYSSKKKQTRRDRFLVEIEAVTPWASLTNVLASYYPSSGGPSRPPVGLKRVLRMYVAPQCFGLSDEGTEICRIRQSGNSPLCWHWPECHTDCCAFFDLKQGKKAR